MRPGGERRGNSQDRARRRVWLLETFDPDLGPELARCHLGLAEGCAGTVNILTLTVDRLDPGGTYARSNIQPACRPCQHRQGALISWERRRQWRDWMDEARAAGIDWDGVM